MPSLICQSESQSGKTFSFSALFTRRIDHPIYQRALLIGLVVAISLCASPGWSEPQEGPPGAPQGAPQQQGPGGGGQGRFKPGAALGFLQDLGLTEEQKTKLKSIQQEGQTQNKALREKNRNLYREMMGYMASPSATEAKALEMQRHIQEEQAKMGEIRLKSWFKIRSVLTPEQIEKINTKFQEHAKRMDSIRDRMGQGGGNGASGGGFGQGGGALGERFRQRRGGRGGQMMQRPGLGGPEEGFAPPEGGQGSPIDGPPPEGHHGPSGQVMDGLFHSLLLPDGPEGG